MSLLYSSSKSSKQLNKKVYVLVQIVIRLGSSEKQHWSLIQTKKLLTLISNKQLWGTLSTFNGTLMLMEIVHKNASTYLKVATVIVTCKVKTLCFAIAFLFWFWLSYFTVHRYRNGWLEFSLHCSRWWKVKRECPRRPRGMAKAWHMLEKLISLMFRPEIPHDELINVVYFSCSDQFFFSRKFAKTVQDTNR